MRKRTVLTIAGSAATVMAIAGAAVAADVAFTDVPDSFWAREFIEWSNDNHVMTGPGGQSRVFQPNKPVTRAELAAVAFRLNVKFQADLDMLARRVRELEARLDIDARGGSSASSVSSSSSVTSRRSSSSSSAVMTPPVGIRPGRLLLIASLAGSSNVPPVETSGRGTARLWWTAEGLRYDVSVAGLSGSILGGRFGLGARGQMGSTIADFPFDGNRAAGIWPTLTSEDWKNLLFGNVYLTVRTSRYPEGEIRGQLVSER